MLPGLGFSEVLILGVIALLVVGPKDLPLMLRKLGRQMARLRGLAAEFRTGFDELARQAELDELKKEVEALRRGQVFTDIEMEAMRTLEPLPPRDAAAGDPTPAPAPPESPPPPADEPPQAPPEVPPISPPAPDGPEPATAKLAT
ncbi:MAG: twin-arginine translocase subunit TatB [Hyphomonadaceae bacterium]|nr:twin-arginine translocase subunit TatB [Hyphomonadaceae bacterium]